MVKMHAGRPVPKTGNSITHRIGWRLPLFLMVVSLFLVALYVGTMRATEQPVEWGVVFLIPLLMLPLALFKASGLRGDEEMNLSVESFLSPRRLIDDTTKSVEEDHARRGITSDQVRPPL